MSMKYLILRTQDGETPIIFPEFMYHDQVEEALDHEEVIAAGFIKIESGKLQCYGESSSLGIASRSEDDAVVIEHHMLTKG